MVLKETNRVVPGVDKEEIYAIVQAKKIVFVTNKESCVRFV